MFRYSRIRRDSYSNRVNNEAEAFTAGLSESSEMVSRKDENEAILSPAVLQLLQQEAQAAGVFESVSVEDDRLNCKASESAEDAWYRVETDQGRIYVSLVMKDRWLSESIEAELMHTGDSIEELLDEELEDAGYEGSPLPVEHFRSEDMYFTFRSPVPVESAADEKVLAEKLKKCLFAYEATFRELGDMQPAKEL